MVMPANYESIVMKVMQLLMFGILLFKNCYCYATGHLTAMICIGYLYRLLLGRNWEGMELLGGNCVCPHIRSPSQPVPFYPAP